MVSTDILKMYLLSICHCGIITCKARQVKFVKTKLDKEHFAKNTFLETNRKLDTCGFYFTKNKVYKCKLKV